MSFVRSNEKEAIKYAYFRLTTIPLDQYKLLEIRN